MQSNHPAPAPAGLMSRNVSFNVHNRKTALAFAWLIFIAALTLRIVGIGEYPAPHKTDDEYHYLWGGLNFWDHGQVETWSGLPGSTHLRRGEIAYDSRIYIMVSPAFDHPPLFTLLSGAAARLISPQRLTATGYSGETVTAWDVDLSRARWMMVVIFGATFWLLYSLAGMAFSPPVALLSILFYGFMSHAVTHGRLVLADNFSGMLLVANAWIVQRWLLDRTSYGRMAACTIILTAAAVLTKIPAWCHAPAMISMLILTRRPREIAWVTIGFATGAAVYLGWVAWYGLDDFISVMNSQSGRFRGFNAFQLMSGVPRLLDVRDLNGLLIAGWFCLLAQALLPRLQARRPGAQALMAIGPVYVLAFTFFAGDVLFGWYSAPLYPWLALALAITTAQVWTRPQSAMMIAWLLLFLPYAFQTLYIARYELETSLRISYVVVVAFVIGAMGLNRKRAHSILRIAIMAVLAVVLMREVYEITNQRRDRLSDQEKYLG